MVIRVSNGVTGRLTENFSVDSGTTLGQWVANNMPGHNISALKITINGARADASSVFTPDCFVQINPEKLSGAAVWSSNPSQGASPASAPACPEVPGVRRRKTLEQAARQDVIVNILAGARSILASAGSDLVSQSVNQLAQLDTISPDHVRDVMALVENTMEQTKRFAAICSKEVEAVAAANDIATTEVPSTHARVFNATSNQRALIRIRAALLAIYQLLISKDEPSVLAELMPTPGNPA